MQARARWLLLACVAAATMLTEAEAEETVLPDGRSYVGEVNEHGEPHGQGVMTWHDPDPLWGGEGRRYEGELREGEPHGKGVITWRGSDQRYEGEVNADGEPHGKGIMTFHVLYRWVWDESLGVGLRQQLHPHEQSFEGDFRHGAPNGQIIITTAEFRYEGGFDMTFNGQGAMTWPCGSRYEGGYRDGWQHGRGVYTKADGTRYDGNWDQGTFDGGIYTPPTGERITCFPDEPCPNAERALR